MSGDQGRSIEDSSSRRSRGARPISSLGTVRQSICDCRTTGQSSRSNRAGAEMAGQAAGPDPLHRAGQSVGERCYNESFNGKLRDQFLNGEIFYTLARGDGTRRVHGCCVEAAVQYRPTPSCRRRTVCLAPRLSRDAKTIALVRYLRMPQLQGPPMVRGLTYTGIWYRNWGRPHLMLCGWSCIVVL